MKRVLTSKFRQSPYSRYGHGLHVLMLECGHEITQKASKAVPKRARCRECYTAAMDEARAKEKAAEELRLEGKR